jgi:hypothetical protein
MYLTMYQEIDYIQNCIFELILEDMYTMKIIYRFIKKKDKTVSASNFSFTFQELVHIATSM